MELGAKQIFKIQECDGSDEWGNGFLKKVA